MRALALLLIAVAAAAAPPEKPTASVLDPSVSDLAPAQAEVLGEVIRDAVVAAGRFRVQDRAAMREILAQQKINKSEICDESCAVEQGRMLQVRFLVSSTIRKVEGEVWLSVRLTNVETGEVVATARDSCGPTMKEMARLAEGLAHQVLTGEKAPAAAPPVAAPPPPPAPVPPAAIAGGETVRFEIIDPEQSFELEVTSGGQTQRCKIARGQPCTLTGLRAGPARLAVRGSSTFTKMVDIPYGNSVGLVQDASQILLYFGLAGLGMIGLSVPIWMYAINNCRWEEPGGSFAFCPDPTLPYVALIAAPVLSILGFTFAYTSLVFPSDFVMISPEGVGGAPAGGKSGLRLERLGVGATREGTPVVGARFRF